MQSANFCITWCLLLFTIGATICHCYDLTQHWLGGVQACPTSCKCHFKEIKHDNFLHYNYNLNETDSLSLFPVQFTRSLLITDCTADPVLELNRTFVEHPTIDALAISNFSNSACLSELPSNINILTSLQYLDVRRHCLTRLPSTLAQLKSLKVLIIEENHFPSFDSVITSVRSLEMIFASGNMLQSLPPSIENLESLKVLTISYNQISFLPSTLGKLHSLKTLFLHDNTLLQLPPEIGHLESLETLTIYRNQLTKLPKQITQLTSLVLFDCGLNNLTYLPDSIGNLTNLRYVYADFNKIDQLPASLGVLPSLLELNVSYNPIKSLPSFERDPSELNFIDMRNCSISRFLDIWWNLNVSGSEFANLMASEKIILADNPMICDCYEFTIFDFIISQGNPISLTCQKPDDLYGLRIANMTRDQLICHVSKNCPFGCSCTDTPHNTSLNIYCPGYRYTRLPEKLPTLRYEKAGYLINMDGKSIANLTERKYISRTAYFSLKDNKITHITLGFFSNAKNLKHVDLRNNYLNTVDIWPLKLILKQPEARIYLDENNISKLTNNLNFDPDTDNKVFHLKNPKLFHISLDKNNISHLSTFTSGWNFTALWLQGLITDQVLSFKENPLECGCQDIEIYALIHYRLKITCSFPLDQNHKEISHVPKSMFQCDLQDDCPLGCICRDIPWHRVIDIYCDNYIQRKLPDVLPKPFNKATDFKYNLTIINSHLTSLHGPKYLVQVANITLSKNHIRTISSEFVDSMRSIEVLRLDGNELESLPVIGHHFPNGKFYFASNMWDCSCAKRSTFEWFNNTQNNVLDYDNIKCHFPDELRNVKVSDVLESKCGINVTVYSVENHHEENPNNPGLTSIEISVPLSLLLLFALLFICFRERIFKKLQLHTKRTNENETEMLFDLFLSYCTIDEHVEDFLIPRLEKENFNIYFHKLFPCGYITASIHQAATRSKKVLVFLSDNYLDDGMCMYEFQTAQAIEAKHRTKSIIVIKDQGLRNSHLSADIQHFIRYHQCLEWGSRHFWKRLLKMLPNYKGRPNNVV